MKKYAFLLAIILMLGVMTACSANSTTPVNSDTPTAMEQQTSAVVSESPATTPESEPTDIAGNEPTETPSQSAASEDSAPTPDSSNKPTEPLKTDSPETSLTPTAPTEPAVTPPPTTSTPIPTEPSVTPTPPAPPAFDINAWIAFAKSYGQQIGLIYDEGTTGSWDNPIPASPTSKYIERDIKAGLNFAKTMNQATYFSVWVEKQADGKYDIYIGYA